MNEYLMHSTFKIEGSGIGATVFFMGRPYANDSLAFIPVLVTAAHVLDSIKADTAVIWLRKKLADGTYEKFAFPIRLRDSGHALYKKNPDPQIDIAVMYQGIPNYAYILPVPMDFLATDSILELYDIHPGDELNSLGFPYGLESNSSGFPILRSGNIASYPLVPGKATKYFLYDMEVFPGNSGGPVYYSHIGRNYKIDANINFIAGLIADEKVIRSYDSILAKYFIKDKLKIAVVMPAYYIRQTILSLPVPVSK